MSTYNKTGGREESVILSSNLYTDRIRVKTCGCLCVCGAGIVVFSNCTVFLI